MERVTVTLPDAMVKDIDRREKNRSRFVAVAVRHELERRRRAELQKSLLNPHPESAALADLGLQEWAEGLPDEDAEGLLDSRAGRSVQWIPGEGWHEPNHAPKRKGGARK